MCESVWQRRCTSLELKNDFSFGMYSLTLVPRDGDYWNLPKWTRNDFWLPHRPVLSHHEEELEKRVRLILLEKLLVPLLVQDDDGLRCPAIPD